MLNWIRKYLNETPLLQLKEEWAYIEEISQDAPNAFDYLDYISTLNKSGLVTHAPPEPKMELISKIASNCFEASFFY